jgi:ribose transport system permease protein
MAGALLMEHMLTAGDSGALTVILGIAAMIAAGTAIGVINGVLITRIKLPPFIVTLGTLTAIGGGTDLLNHGTEITNLPGWVTNLGTSSILSGWLPVQVLIALAVAVIAGLILGRTRFGLRTYAIGSNEAGARRSGIRVDRHLVIVYAISGCLAGLAGLLVTANFDSASPIAGANDELYAIASVVIGGASIFGGRGTMFGTFIGTAILSVLTTGLILTNVAPFWQQVAIGVVVVAAVAIDRIRTRVGTD